MSSLKNLPDWNNWLLEKKANEAKEELAKVDPSLNITMQNSEPKSKRDPKKSMYEGMTAKQKYALHKERYMQKEAKKWAQTMQAQANLDRLKDVQKTAREEMVEFLQKNLDDKMRRTAHLIANSEHINDAREKINELNNKSKKKFGAQGYGHHVQVTPEEFSRDPDIGKSTFIVSHNFGNTDDDSHPFHQPGFTDHVHDQLQEIDQHMKDLGYERHGPKLFDHDKPNDDGDIAGFSLYRRKSRSQPSTPTPNLNKDPN